MAARIDIINSALARVGAQLLQSEDASGAAQILLVYDDVLRTLLGHKRWIFATRTVSLNRLTAAPSNDFWTYQFKLPNDRVGLPDAYFDRPRSETAVPGGKPFTDYELSEDVVLTDAERLWCKYRYAPAISMWPALFRECVTVGCAAEYALSVNLDADLRDALRKEVFGDPRIPGALGLVGKASSFDQQSRASRIMDVDGGPLIDVRRPGG